MTLLFPRSWTYNGHRRESAAAVDQIYDRGHKHLGFLLRKIMARARHDAVGASTAELRCGCSAIVRWDDPIRSSVQCNRGDRNRRQGRKAALQICVLRIADDKTEAMAIAMDYNIDIVGIVECRCRAVEGRIIEMPVWRPLLP